MDERDGVEIVAFADGRWAAAYASQKNATVPADLAEALAGDQAAQAFEALNQTDRYQLILPPAPGPHRS